jgi:membrane protease subunit HflK
VIDGYVLTADGNIVHSRATLNYRISDPIRHVFGFTNASTVVTNALDNALLATAAQFNVDDILTRDVTGFKDAVRRRVTDLLDREQVGVSVEQCYVESRPPRQLKEKFAEVLKAEVTRNQKLDEARSYENQVVSRASAEATGRVNIAESERTRLVQSIAAEAERFKGLLPNYERNPKLFVQQNLVQTMTRVLTNVTDKIYLPTSADGKPIELRLLLNREPPKPKTETPAQ